MKVKINKHTFTIIEVGVEPNTGDNLVTFGETNYIEEIIKINVFLSKEQKRQTLIHELTHAFMWSYGLGHITEQMPIELMCDFIGTYADDIIKIADLYEGGVNKC